MALSLHSWKLLLIFNFNLFWHRHFSSVNVMSKSEKAIQRKDPKTKKGGRESFTNGADMFDSRPGVLGAPCQMDRGSRVWSWLCLCDLHHLLQLIYERRQLFLKTHHYTYKQDNFILAESTCSLKCCCIWSSCLIENFNLHTKEVSKNHSKNPSIMWHGIAVCNENKLKLTIMKEWNFTILPVLALLLAIKLMTSGRRLNCRICWIRSHKDFKLKTRHVLAHLDL